MDFFNNLLRGAQGVGQNLLNRVGSIQTPISAGNRAQPQQRITLGDIGNNLGNNLGNAYNQVANATQAQRDAKAARSVPILIQDPKTGRRIANPNQAGINSAIDLAGGSMNGENKFAGMVGKFANAKSVEDVAKNLAGMFGDAAKKISPDIVSGLQKATDPGQINGLLKQAGAMAQMHSTPIADATKSAIVNELHSVGEHNAANLASQAQTHGDIIDALRGTQLHPEAPVSAPYNIHPIAPLHPEGTPLSGMDPTAMAAHQAQAAEQTQHTINMNKLLADKQAAADAAKTQVTPDGTIRGGGLAKPQMPGIEKYQARAAAYKTQEAAMSQAEMAAREANAPAPHEMAQMDANAAITKPPTEPIKIPTAKPEPVKIQTAQPTKPVNPLIQEILTGKPSKSEPMLPNQTGSAHENQPMAKPEPSGYPKDAKPAPASQSAPSRTNRGYDENGNLTRLTDTQTGENHVAQDTTMQPYKNALLEENKTAYGAHEGNNFKPKAGDVAAIHGDMHGGHVGSLSMHVSDLVNNLRQRFSPKEMEMMTYAKEGSLKAGESITPEQQQIVDQWKNLGDIHNLHNQEANPKSGEIDNHTAHIDKNSKHFNDPSEKQTIGFGKYSVKNARQMQQGRVKFTSDTKGVADRYGTYKEAKLKSLGDNKYVDRKGNIYHAQNTTIRELNEKGGFKYETDASKIIGHSFMQQAKTANNLKLGRNLATADHGNNIIRRMPGEKTPPKGYVASHLPHMQEHWMSKAYHDRLYTSTDDTKGLLYHGGSKLASILGSPTKVINETFFAENSMYHQLVNEAGQAPATMSLGAGEAHGHLAAAFGGAKNFAQTTKLLQDGRNAVMQHGPGIHAYLKAGGRLSTSSADKIGQVTKGVISKLKVLGDKSQFLNHISSKYIGDTVRVTKFLHLTQQGMNPRAAVEAINHMQGDYSNMSRFTKDYTTKLVQFLPFFMHQAKSLGYAGVGAIKNPGVYAGAAVGLASTYAAYAAFNKLGQIASNNPYFHVTKGGALGLVDDVIKAPGQIMGYKDKAGVQHPGTLPSLITKRLTPVEKLAAEQTTGKDVSTNTAFDTSAQGRLAQAGKAVTQVNQGSEINAGKRAPFELALNANGIYTPHGAHTPAVPNAVGTPYNGLFNVEGMNSKTTVDAANAAKAAGGSKLASYQYARLSGDNSLDSFWKKNPTLDPNSTSFKGFTSATGSANVTAGKNLIKSQGGSSLSYMQALKASGSSQYDKFFQQNPTLDPTSSGFQAKPSSSQKYAIKQGKAAVKYAAKGAKFTQSKAAATGHYGTKGAGKSVSIPGMKHASLRTAMRSSVRSTKFVAPKMTSTPTTKIKLAKSTTSGRHIGLSLKA